jgi:hypothetical protein
VDRQCFERVQYPHIPSHLTGIKFEARQAAEHGLNRDRSFQTGESRAKTEVNALAKGQLTGWRSPDVQAVGIRERIRVSIRGTHQREHRLPFLYLLVRQFKIFVGDPS